MDTVLVVVGAFMLLAAVAAVLYVVWGVGAFIVESVLHIRWLIQKRRANDR